jgi:hypothetical protein
MSFIITARADFISSYQTLSTGLLVVYACMSAGWLGSRALVTRRTLALTALWFVVGVDYSGVF